MKTLIGVVLIVHGFIVAAQSSGAFTGGKGVANPAWLSWWPTALGESWVARSPAPVVGVIFGVLWLAAGLCLVGAGLGVFGVIVPVSLWRTLAIIGAGLSLLMLIIYAHPFFVLGLLLSLIILYTQLVTNWPPDSLIGG